MAISWKYWRQGHFKKVITDDQVYETRTVIVATGALKHRLWELPIAGTEQSRCFLLCGLWWSFQIKICSCWWWRFSGREALFFDLLAKTVPLFTAEMNFVPQKVLQDCAFANEKVNLSGILLSREIRNRVEFRRIWKCKTGQVIEQAFAVSLSMSVWILLAILLRWSGARKNEIQD